MKQRLLFASSLALIMASCTQTEFEQLGQTPVEGKGIQFTTSISEGIGTRAELSPSNNVFNHHWYADKDKIGVLYKTGCYVAPISGQDYLAIGGSAGWMGHKNTAESNPFVFKASASGTTGYFVATNDDNVLELSKPGVTPDPTKAPTFRAYWPVAVAPATNLATNGQVALPALATQIQTGTEGQGIVNNAFMISESTSDAEYDANDNSVSKNRFNLKFKRVDPIVYFKIKAATLDKDIYTNNREYVARYSDLFLKLGTLSAVKLESKGGVKADGTAATPSKLTHNTDAAWDMSKADLSKGFVDGVTGAVATITTTMTPATQWSNDATAFMVVAPVDRTQFGKTEKEKMTATYTFANVQLEKSITTNKNWMVEERNWYGFPSESGYDLDQQQYIAYATIGGFVLQLNPSFTGKLSAIFDASGNLKGINKTDGSAINKTDITEFVSKVDITDAADFTTIQSLALTHVTLMENTTIPSKAFSSLTSITYLNLPKVITVATDAFSTAATYKEVFMGSYDFSNAAGTNQEAVRGILLKAANLVRADISAVADLNAGFPQTGVKFTDFKQLTDITVKSGALVGGSTFQNCEKLALVRYSVGVANGSVNLAEGSNSQFLGCKVLPAIAISNKVIPDAAFSGCKILDKITDAAGNGIQPTKIGISAFEGCEAIVDMDLSVATIIENAAFKGCTALVGNDNVKAGKTVLYVNSLMHVSDNVFNGCRALKFISFGAAETVGTGFLEGTTCTEIEFLKKFAGVTTADKSFGTIDNTILFCNKAQEGITINSITVGKIAFAFKSINAKY